MARERKYLMDYKEENPKNDTVSFRRWKQIFGIKVDLTLQFAIFHLSVHVFHFNEVDRFWNHASFISTKLVHLQFWWAAAESWIIRPTSALFVLNSIRLYKNIISAEHFFRCPVNIYRLLNFPRYRRTIEGNVRGIFRKKNLSLPLSSHVSCNSRSDTALRITRQAFSSHHCV